METKMFFFFMKHSLNIISVPAGGFERSFVGFPAVNMYYKVIGWSSRTSDDDAIAVVRNCIAVCCIEFTPSN